MAAVSHWRTAATALLGGLLYYVLLGLIYSKAPYTSVPAWFGKHAFSEGAATVSWFSLINIGGALLAAFAIVVGLLLSNMGKRLKLALVIGLVPALYIATGALREYGLPSSTDAWAVTSIQFVAISVAIVALLAVGRALPANSALYRDAPGLSRPWPGNGRASLRRAGKRGR